MAPGTSKTLAADTSRYPGQRCCKRLHKSGQHAVMLQAWMAAGAHLCSPFMPDVSTSSRAASFMPVWLAIAKTRRMLNATRRLLALVLSASSCTGAHDAHQGTLSVSDPDMQAVSSGKCVSAQGRSKLAQDMSRSPSLPGCVLQLRPDFCLTGVAPGCHRCSVTEQPKHPESAGPTACKRHQAPARPTCRSSVESWPSFASRCRPR